MPVWSTMHCKSPPGQKPCCELLMYSCSKRCQYRRVSFLQGEESTRLFHGFCKTLVWLLLKWTFHSELLTILIDNNNSCSTTLPLNSRFTASGKSGKNIFYGKSGNFTVTEVNWGKPQTRRLRGFFFSSLRLAFLHNMGRKVRESQWKAVWKSRGKPGNFFTAGCWARFLFGLLYL